MKVCSKAFLTSIINDIFMQVNLLESHVEEFLESKGDGAVVGYWLEQSTKSCHHDLKMEVENDKLSSESQEYLDRLLSIVVRYNSKHLKYVSLFALEN